MSRSVQRRAQALSCALLLLASAVARAEGSQPKRVLLIKSFGANLAPWYGAAAALRTTLAQEYDAPIETIEVSLDLRLGDGRAIGEALLGYLQMVFKDSPPDLVVPLGRPAVLFALQARASLFPKAPMLATGVASFGMKGIELGPNSGAVMMETDVRDHFARGMGFQPREVVAVVGSTSYELHWRPEIHRLLSAMNAPVTDTVGMSLADIKKRVETLSPDSLVVFTVFSVDGAGVPWEFDDAQRAILASSRAPVVSTVETDLGSGSLGVLPLPAREAGRLAGKEAARILWGGEPRVLPPVKAGPMRFDERVVNRLAFRGWQLPEGGELHFHEPSTWERVAPYALGAGLVLVVESGLIVLLLLNRRRRIRAEREAHLLTQAVMTAQEEERARIARELHDDLSQRVAHLSLLANKEGSCPEDKNVLSAELSLLGKGLYEVAYSLHPASLEANGLGPSVEAECARISRATGLPVQVDVSGLQGEALPPAVSLCAYRVIQEALRNASRHGKPRSMGVLLARRDGGLQVAVSDDGEGFSLRDGGRRGIGLRSMQERVQQLGGEVDVESAPGEGTEVVAWLPLGDTQPAVGGAR